MPNTIKYSTTGDTLSLKKGNLFIGVGDVGKGPSTTTQTYNGVSPVASGYTIYIYNPTQASNVSFYSANNGAELITFTNGIAGQTFTGVTQCLNWYVTQTNYVCVNRDYESIVTNGLRLCVNGNYTPSYTTSGVTMYDLSYSGNNSTLTNGPNFNSENGGCISLDGTNDYISIPQSSLFGTDRTFTLMMWVYAQPSTNYSGLLRINGTLMFYNPGSGTVGSTGGSYRLAYPYPSVSYQSLTLPINSWYLLTLTNLDSQTPSYQGYSINGAALTTTTYTGRIEVSDIRIGMADSYVVGKVGAILSYNRVLTNAEIKQNYNAFISNYNLYANPSTVFGASLTLWLDTSLPTATSNTVNFNTIDTTSTSSFSRIYDRSGNNNHASQINKNRQPTIGTTSNGKNISVSDGSKGFALGNVSNGQRTIIVVHKNSSLSMGRGGASNGYVLQGTSFYGYSNQFNFAPYNNQVRCNLPSPAANNQLQITILVSFSDRTEAYTTTSNGTITSSTTVMKNNYYLGNNTLNYLTNSDSNFQVGIFCRNLGGDNAVDSFEAGEFAEMIVVNRISTASEISTLQNYLYNKWFN
jgi:energy-coupling factor transporter ATP-binding protein EcfA2